MAAGGARPTPQLAFQDRMQQKKMMVDELLALRRARLMRKKKPLKPIPHSRSPTTGRVYEAYNVLSASADDLTRETVSQDHVRKLMKGTTLEEELNETYGEIGIEDATESYVRRSTSSDGFRNGSQAMNGDDGKRLFFHKLMKDRKSRLEAMRQRRLVKEQELIQKKEDLKTAQAQLRQSDGNNEFNEADSDDENLKQLVEVAKQNIGDLERKLRDLKQQEYTKKSLPTVFKKPPAIDYEFKPWQAEQVNIATDIVDNIIKKALEICVYSENDLESTLLKELLEMDNEALDRVNRQELMRNTAIDIMKEIEDEVSAVIIKKVAEEFVLVNKLIQVSAADLVINSSFTSVHNKPLKEAKSKGIGQTWVAMANHRNTARYNIWGHAKGVVSKASSTSTTKQPEVNSTPLADETDDDDITVLSYDQTPLSNNVFSGEIWDDYLKAECSLWESSTVSYTLSAFDLAYQRIIAVSCLAISADHRYVAVGTFHGDIVVFDVMWEPYRPIRCVAYVGKKPERILQIDWSLDGSRILSLSETLCLIIWSVSYPSPTTSSDLQRLGIPIDKDDRHRCHQLTALVMLEASVGDFNIVEGTLSSSVLPGVFDVPLVAFFSPAIDATGSQNFVVIGFSSGEILKCNLTTAIASRLSGLFSHQYTRPKPMYINGGALLSKDNKLQSGIEVDLYHSHKIPILEIHFIQNCGDMVSIDQILSICIWKDSTEHLTGSDWLIPFHKLHLNASEVVMVPKGEEKIIFEDEITLKKNTKGKKRKAKTVIEQERKEALSEIKALRLASRKPWYSDDQKLDDARKKKKDGKFFKKTYAPLAEEIFDPAADQTFYSTTKQRSSNLLVKLSSQTYSISYHKSKALIGIDRSADGRKWYFMFLYAKHEPNIKAHVTFISIDLLELDMLQSVVIKYFMEQSEFDEVVKNKQISFAVTRNYQIPDSDYIFCYISGKMHMFSMFTGSEVGWCAPDKKSKVAAPEIGLQFPPKLSALKGRFKLAAICPDGRVTRVILLHQPSNRQSEAISPLFTLTSTSSSTQHLVIKKLKKELQEHERETFIKDRENSPLEQSVLLKKYTVRDMPIELYMKRTLNSIVDNAVAIVTGQRMTNEQRVRLWAKDWAIMQKYFDATE